VEFTVGVASDDRPYTRPTDTFDRAQPEPDGVVERVNRAASLISGGKSSGPRLQPV